MKIRPKEELHSPEYLRRRLRYDEATGKLYWRVRDDGPPCWNGKFAGKEAGTFKEGYRSVHIEGQHLLAHRVIWAMAHNEWPHEEIDHENHIKTDNRLSNLKPANRFNNTQNTTFNKNNTSGYRGVVFHKREKKWRAVVKHNKKLYHLGSYIDKEEANRVAMAARERFGFHSNHGAPCVDTPASDT